MSIPIIVCMHGEAAEELKNTIEMIMGKQKDLLAINFYPNEGPEDIIKKIEKVLGSADEKNPGLILVDLFGGSPFNAAAEINLINENVKVVTGVNIPMLIEIVSLNSGKSPVDLAKIAKDVGQEAIQILDLE